MASDAPAETVYRVHDFEYHSSCGENCNQDTHVKGNIDIAVNNTFGNVSKYTEDRFDVYTTKQSDDNLNKQKEELTNLINDQKKLIEELRALLIKRLDALPVEIANEEKVYTALKARLQSDFDKVYVAKPNP